MSHKYQFIGSYQWTSFSLTEALVQTGLKMEDIKNINGFPNIFFQKFSYKMSKYFFIISNKICNGTQEKTKYEDKGRQMAAAQAKV